MTETKPITMVIADDHSIIRVGIKLLFRANPLITIYEASNGDELFEQIKKYSPDIVLLDINMPNTNSQTLLQTILTIKPQLSVLVFSVNKEEIYGKLYLKLGARGYLQKDAPPEDIVKAVDCILAGNVYIRKDKQDMYLGGVGAREFSPYFVLSKKEMEVLPYLSSGDSVMNIARSLNLSPSTIGTHKSNIFSKLHITNIIELKELIALHPLS
ncbi:MAG: response regulator transcription factor [Chitinophagaceae bacterium]